MSTSIMRVLDQYPTLRRHFLFELLSMLVREKTELEVPAGLKLEHLSDETWIQRYEELGALNTAAAAPLGFGPELFR